MAKLWDRLRRRFGGGDELERAATSMTTEVSRAQAPIESPSPELPAVATTITSSYAAQEVVPATHESVQTAVPQWWLTPSETNSASREGATNTPTPIVLPPELQPLAREAPPAARDTVVEDVDAGSSPDAPAHVPSPETGDGPWFDEISTTDESEILAPEILPDDGVTATGVEGTTTDSVAGGPDETLAELKEHAIHAEAQREAETNAASDEDPAHTGAAVAEDWRGNDTEDMDDDVSRTGAPGGVRGDVDTADLDVEARADASGDDEEEDDEDEEPSAETEWVAAPRASNGTGKRRGRRREPEELDGQPARLALPGRPLKRNEVPTLDTPLLVWSHDASGEVVVRPSLYACVQTQWYGSSLYFLVIPWGERDAPERSARLVVDATQLRVAPAEMAKQA